MQAASATSDTLALAACMFVCEWVWAIAEKTAVAEDDWTTENISIKIKRLWWWSCEHKLNCNRRSMTLSRSSSRPRNSKIERNKTTKQRNMQNDWCALKTILRCRSVSSFCPLWMRFAIVNFNEIKSNEIYSCGVVVLLLAALLIALENMLFY